MEDAFFSQLDGNAVRELLLRTELRHAALFAVSDTLRIERCSDAAQQLSGLHPMEELDPFLSGSTRNILLRCINTQSACTAEEDIDGTVYTVEMIPHRGGALLAYLRRDRAAYDPFQWFFTVISRLPFAIFAYIFTERSSWGSFSEASKAFSRRLPSRTPRFQASSFNSAGRET